MPNRNLIVVPHTHWDREWYRTHEQFRHQLVELLDGVLDLLERDEDFAHFTLDGQVIVLDDYLEVRPEARARIERLIRAGRLLIGPWTVLPDEWLVSGEALIRNLRLGLRRAEPFGGAMRLGYVPDQFGHVGQLPQIFAGFGFDAAVLWRGVGDDVVRAAFEWEAPDGTRVWTVYLERGYGNAANLPLDPGALTDWLSREIDRQEGSRLGRTLLLMNGSDHLAPQPGLPRALRVACAALDCDFEIATLPRFVALQRQEAGGAPQRHRGELRSGLRAPLLEGCASARIAQKREDFRNDSLLTRYVEPLAAWLQALGGEPDCGMIDYLWRVALENHPHDSICGCSIDAVHDQMDTRFARVREAGRAHLARVARALGGRVRAVTGTGEGASIAVWNPGAAGVARIEGAVELDVPDRVRRPVLRARRADGSGVAVHAEPLRAADDLAEYTVPASVCRKLLRGFPPEFMGLFVAEARMRPLRGAAAAGAVWDLTLVFADAKRAAFDFAAAKTALDARLAAEGEKRVRFRARRPALWSLRFVDALPGCGLRTYRLEPGPEPAGSEVGGGSELRADSLEGGGASIANATWRIDVDAKGRIDFTDLRTATTIRDALSLLDEGDRGDEYTFDPVAGEPAGAAARVAGASVRLGPRSAAEVSLVVRKRLRVPRELAADRSNRSSRTAVLPVTLTLRLAPGLDRIDVDVETVNTARDHRLRLAVRAPFGASRFEVESAFEVAQRPIAPKPGDFGRDRPAELPTGATPQRSFATLVGDAAALTVANRGAPEVEALPGDGGSQLALTLVRAVGWLSRGDLSTRPMHAGPPLETPGAQSPGRHIAELSVRLHAPDEAERAAHAHRFAHPPLVFAVEGGGAEAPLGDGDRLLEVDDPAVAVSAIEPGRDGARVRVVNLSDRARNVALRWNGARGSALVACDLAGRARAGAASGAHDAHLGAWRIGAYRVAPTGGSSGAQGRPETPNG